MLSKEQKERLIQASAVDKEIKQGSHGEQWERLTQETRDKVLRRIAEVEYELVTECPSAFTQDQIEYVRKERKSILRRETKKGLRFNYKTKKLVAISA
jgi:acyl-CoA reductase-like NAD-dependent aldehyde dehydrogenase